MAEGLGRLIKSHVSQNLIHGWQWGNGLPTLSHLQFVDDTTLAGRAQIWEVGAFWLTLDTYLAAFGQKINDRKSFIFLSNTPEPMLWRITNILRFWGSYCGGKIAQAFLAKLAQQASTKSQSLDS